MSIKYKMSNVSYFERGTYNLVRTFYLNKKYNNYKKINTKIYENIKREKNNKKDIIFKSNK